MSESNQHLPEERPSKSQRKRDMTALQKLGETLVNLPSIQLAKIPIDDDLLQAIKAIHTFKSHEARRRQLQYIGRLMRNIDTKPIEDALAKIQKRG